MTSLSKNSSSQFVDDLIDEAMRITNNTSYILTNKNLSARSNAVPRGRIRVWDDRLNQFVGVRGAIVRTTHWFSTGSAVTDNNGNFILRGRSSGRGFRYSIKWARDDYSIRTTFGGRPNANDQAYLMGPNRGGWNIDIADNSLQQLYSFIHLATYHYYYEDILGLKRSPQNIGSVRLPRNRGYSPRVPLNIAAINGEGRAYFNSSYISSNIRKPVNIYRYENGVNVNCERLYSTTIHELAHASHWELRQGNFSHHQTSRKLKENWAVGVTWSLTRQRYPTHNWWANVDFNWMTSTPGGENIYTPLIIDLRNNLRNQYNNPTDQFLNELFEQYQNLARKSS